MISNPTENAESSLLQFGMSHVYRTAGLVFHHLFFNLLEKGHTLAIQPVLWVKTLHWGQHIYIYTYLYALHIQKQLRPYQVYGRSVIGLCSHSVHWKEHRKHSTARNPDNCISSKLWKPMEGKPFTMDTVKHSEILNYVTGCRGRSMISMPREVMGAPSLEIFKTRLDKVLCSLL